MISQVCPHDQWSATLLAYDILLPENATLQDKGRLDERSHPDKKNVGYWYQKTDSAERLYVRNYRTDEEFFLITSKSRKGSKADKADHEFFASSQNAAQQAYAEAAKRARDLLEAAAPATDEHPYLQKKYLPAYPDTKVDSENNLLIPITNPEGEVCSVQFISPEGSKRNLSGGCLKAGRYHFGLPKERVGNIIVIAEGWATGASIHESTGWPVNVAFGKNNLMMLATELRAKLPRSELLFAADNDVDSETNGGVVAATKAALNCGGSVAVPKVIDNKPTDFSDVFIHEGPEEVKRQLIEAHSKYSFARLPVGFSVEWEEGCWWLCQTMKDDISIVGDMLYVTAYCRTTGGTEWSTQLEFVDPDHSLKKVLIPNSQISSDSAEWIGQLTSNGYRLIAGKKMKLAEYITSCKPNRRVLLASQTGWFNDSFVTPGKVYNGPETEVIELDHPKRHGGASINGSLEDWQEKLGSLLAGNPLYLFAVCAALAGPLLKIFSIGSGGVHFFGNSSCGKTTLLRLASSVWGTFADMIRTWRATDNGLEGIAAARNDLLLCLDEIHQADPNKVGSIIYMLGNEMGKQRAARDGQARATFSWRLMVLSSGEKSIEGKLSEASREFSAGQDVRVASIPVNPEDVRELHSYKDAAAFTQAIEQHANEFYGTLGDAYLELLTHNVDVVRGRWQSDLHVIVKELLSKYPDASPQVGRGAHRFALCAFAGKLAVEWGLLAVSEHEVMHGVAESFDRWIETRGGYIPSEKLRVLRLVKSFIEAHADSRFIPTGEDTGRIINCVGFVLKDANTSKRSYAFYPEAFRAEVLNGYPINQACTYLKEENWLIHDTGRNTTRRMSRAERKTVYLISIPSDDEDSDNEVADAPANDTSLAISHDYYVEGLTSVEDELGFSF